MKKYIFDSIELSYCKGELYSILTLHGIDIISWEALRHDIPFYEDQLDKSKWICLQ